MPSESSRGTKREASREPAVEGSAKRPTTAGSDSRASSDPPSLGTQVEALVAAHINTRATKEISSVGNPGDLQQKVDEAKTVEWHTVSGRNAVRLVLGHKVEQVRKRYPGRIIGSRFVNTWKIVEDSLPQVKARWCLQGHLHPDLSDKALAGDLQLSQVGRSMLFQLLASHG